MALILEVLLLILKSIYIIVHSVFRKFVPLLQKSVKNEIVLITGAGRGIGKELALQYAALGATVVCWGISKSKNVATVDEIAELGYPKAYFYECDVSNYDMVIKTAKTVRQEVGDVTILINNAGVGIARPFLQQTYNEIKNCLDTNLMSQFWTIQAFLPAMLKNNHGHIVCNNSMCGLFAGRDGLPYSASKFGTRAVMEALHHELRINPACEIKLTTVYPYIVETGMWKQALIRFPQLMPILNPKEVAKKIISAQRRNLFELAIPELLNIFSILYTPLPVAARNLVYDFIDVSIDT